jgi:imidazolonepropionase-like amidohydrolase
MEVLTAATVNGARKLGIDHQVGTVEVGKIADIVVLDGDPTRNLRDLSQTMMVVTRGIPYTVERTLKRAMDARGR